MTEIINPQRLVFIQTENNCMFCEKPKGPSYSYYVSLTDKMGFLACGKCKDKGNEALDQWHLNIAYGKARYLKDKIIKIKRSSGEIEDGWSLDNPLTGVDNRGIEVIHCYNQKEDIGRWCKLKEILDLNPPASEAVEVPSANEVGANEVGPNEAVIEEFKNLCVECGVDMGPDNPRQLCGKWRCNN
jgi:ribosomal protein S27AE